MNKKKILVWGLIVGLIGFMKGFILEGVVGFLAGCFGSYLNELRKELNELRKEKKGIKKVNKKEIIKKVLYLVEKEFNIKNACKHGDTKLCDCWEKFKKKAFKLCKDL